jgi:hypothetical protein
MVARDMLSSLFNDLSPTQFGASSVQIGLGEFLVQLKGPLQGTSWLC